MLSATVHALMSSLATACHTPCKLHVTHSDAVSAAQPKSLALAPLCVRYLHFEADIKKLITVVARGAT